MPLSEFLRMAGRKIESGQQKPSQTDLSSRSESDLVELVWENGNITMQGQSSRATRGPALNNLPLNTNKAPNARIGKFSGVESILNDMSPVVPSGDLGLSQDEEMVPWLDALTQDYGSVLLPEISGVTANGISVQNSFASVDRRSSCEHTISNLHSGGGSSKAPSSKARFLSSCPPPQHRHTSDFISNHSNRSDVPFGNSAQGRDIVNDSSSMKMERQNIGPPTNSSSNYLNFSHFARPANLVKTKVPNSGEIPSSVSSGVDVKEKGVAASGNPVKLTLAERFNSSSSAVLAVGKNSGQQAVGKATDKDSCPIERAENLCQETSVKNDRPLILSIDSTNGFPNGERTVEPMVASSSVGSENSADRVSCEQTHNSKRKFRDTDSECPSDDVETESVGLNKPTPGRGSGSKRSRAAEVHNLSERRRRDRINEKMRALQELIPNCNKADKASMLDEAIEYLKTLQLQVQIMSMGAGLCMPPMMYAPGMQHVHPAHMPHFSPMGVGMGMGMGFGMGMLDMNGGAPVFPISPLQAPHFSGAMPTNFQRMPGPNVPVYGHPGQGIPNSVPRTPSVPLTTQPPILSNGSGNAKSSTSPILNSGDITNMNSHSNCDAEAGSSINQKSNKPNSTNEVLNHSATVQENKQPTDGSGPSNLTPTTETDISKEQGFD